MRAIVCTVCLSIALLLTTRAAQAQAPPAPQDKQCQDASKTYTDSVTGNSHRTPEEQREAVYEAGKKYLQTCGDRGDSFTRAVRMWVSAYEAAKLRRAAAQAGATPPPTKECDEAKADMLKRTRDCCRNPDEQKAAYEASKEFLKVCSDAPDEETRQMLKFVSNWVEKYDAALREFELRRAARLRGALGADAADALKGLLTKPR